jgi:hypothetical protein
MHSTHRQHVIAEKSNLSEIYSLSEIKTRRTPHAAPLSHLFLFGNRNGKSGASGAFRRF